MEAFPALSLIREEHRRMTAVIRCLDCLTLDAAARSVEPDYRLLTMLLDYIEAFPDRSHHPKEDEYLFKRLRNRTSETGDVLAELEAEHARGRELIHGLRDALSRCQGGGARAVEALASVVTEYADLHWKHVRKEEDLVMPAAERALSPADWDAIHAAFQRDDLGAAAEEFRRLYRLIVRLAPPAVVRLLVAMDS
jgi:hemerythrin-like domain-containing protein